MAKTARTWTMAEANASFDTVIDRALAEGPQAIKRNGRNAVVVVSAAEWERGNKRRNLAEFFASSPLRGSRLRIRRATDKARKIKP